MANILRLEKVEKKNKPSWDKVAVSYIFWLYIAINFIVPNLDPRVFRWQIQRA